MSPVPRYKNQHTPWLPDWSPLTIWDCIADLIEQERGSKIHPPRAPAIIIEEWRKSAIRIANDAIRANMRKP